MKHWWMIIAVLGLTLCLGHAEETKMTGDVDGFLRQVVRSLLANGNDMTFEIADKVVAIDNGEILTREELKKAWPEFARRAIKTKVTVDQFFRDVELRVTSPSDNKRLMGNKRVLEAYKYQDGDLYCDASHVKEGVKNFIEYDKAFIFIIRKAGGKWTLIGIGG